MSAVERRKLRALSQPRDEAAGERSGEIDIVPFLDIIVNVTMFVIATLPALFGSTITAAAANQGDTRNRDDGGLRLTVLLVAVGVSLKTAGGNVGPGCAPGPGLSIPNVDGKYDWAAVKACATRLKREVDGAAHETSAQIIAEPAVDYQSVVAATDALRESDDPGRAPLFPDVTFGVAR